MPTRLSLAGYGASWSTKRRVTVVTVTVVVLLAIATAVAWFTGRNNHPNTGPSPSASHSTSPAPGASAPAPGPGSGSVPRPPQISEPVAYAKAAAAMLWSYDTRATSHDQQLAGMQAWMTKEAKYADWASASGQVPDPLLWSRMADQDQHAAATVTEAHFPTAFKQALADDPPAITQAYVYVVTVNGKQTIAWKKGGGAEDRALTLAVQCRPQHDCTLAAIAPTVTQ
ncbi:hypothetical protein ACFC0M_06065 [Streptomyces sp. NPDC056149]|uniref:hypothetical protein n=1 Tax=Streptomyces sp. NPDC056149 TaxID=3345728 RepID=UPI0035DB90FE